MEARDFRQKVKQFVTAERNRLGSLADLANQLRVPLTAYQIACKESTTLAENLKTLDDRKTELDKIIVEMAEKHHTLISHFARLFDALAKELLGEEVTGEVHLRKGIEPNLTYRG